ncbi:hypothetical protein [Streptomyces sp. AP-93]|uniref:hypothetical protein n=1 Tax=Streptomyces sp. AP-93 TaxID=2929048 RepID=UPI001FAE8214|nr:hypothetical protein [Streptomyces sp. AP-93]MCJ0874786.1 hypothetical protein [Streptomyces sp. AP-93]
MNGSGSGGFAAPVKIADNCCSSYNALIGIDGTGSGTFKAPVKIGTGWQTYSGLF